MNPNRVGMFKTRRRRGRSARFFPCSHLAGCAPGQRGGGGGAVSSCRVGLVAVGLVAAGVGVVLLAVAENLTRKKWPA